MTTSSPSLAYEAMHLCLSEGPATLARQPDLLLAYVHQMMALTQPAPVPLAPPPPAVQPAPEKPVAKHKTKAKPSDRWLKDHYAVAFGRRQSLYAWARESGISPMTIYKRLARGETAEDAITRPLHQRRKAKPTVEIPAALPEPFVLATLTEQDH